MAATLTLTETHELTACTDGECPEHPMCPVCDETGKDYCPACGEAGGPSGDPAGCTTCAGTGFVPCACR